MQIKAAATSPIARPGTHRQRRTCAHRPAHPCRPEDMADEVSAAGDLRTSEEGAGHKRQAEHCPGAFWIRAAQQEVPRKEAERGARMARWKAAPCAAIRYAPGPVAHLFRAASELGQVPGATREADALDTRNHQKRHQCHHEPQQTLALRRPGPGSTRGIERPRARNAPGQPTTAIMQDVRRQQRLPQRKACGLAEPSRDGQIAAAEVPETRQRAPQHQHQDVARSDRPLPAGAYAGLRRHSCARSKAGS